MNNRRSLILGLFATFLLGSAPAMAAPLGLTLADTPDIVSGFIDVNYDAGSNALSADGFALQLDAPGINAIAGGLFDLDAVIDNAGNLVGGSFSIFGTIAGLGFNSGTLLTGNLTAFGFPDAGGNPLEFLFTVTGGDAAALFGADGGMILGQTGFGGDWGSDFDNLISGIPGTGQGSADTAAMPASEPGILFLQALGLAMLFLARRRRT